MSDELTRAVAEALGCEVVRADIGRPFWCEQHAAWSNDRTCPEARRIAAALAPLIEARVREARFSAVPGSLYNDVMGLLLSHPDYKALLIAEELKNHIGASAQRRAAREAAGSEESDD